MDHPNSGAEGRCNASRKGWKHQGTQQQKRRGKVHRSQECSQRFDFVPPFGNSKADFTCRDQLMSAKPPQPCAHDNADRVKWSVSNQMKLLEAFSLMSRADCEIDRTSRALNTVTCHELNVLMHAGLHVCSEDSRMYNIQERITG